MALRNNVKRPLKSVQERTAEAKARTQAQVEKIAAKRNVTPQERAANVVNYGSMESSSLLKSMFCRSFTAVRSSPAAKLRLWSSPPSATKKMLRNSMT